jgi:hypothetical protein
VAPQTVLHGVVQTFFLVPEQQIVTKLGCCSFKLLEIENNKSNIIENKVE